MIEHSIREGMIEFRVQVVPRASKSEIVGEHSGSLRVRIAAPPVDGAANEELIRVLAKRLEVPRKLVSIVGGRSSKLKQVRIDGIDAGELMRRLQEF